MLVLMENGIWEFSNIHMTPPTYLSQLGIHNQKDVKAKTIILDGVKDHLIPHLSQKSTVRDLWEALKGLFHSKNENRKMVLKEKLKDTKITRSNTMTTYLTWI
jgi:hypothetical protein